MSNRWVMSAGLHGAEELLRSLGVNPVSLAYECGIPASALRDKEIPLDAENVSLFYEQGALLSKQRNFGLLLSEYHSGSLIGPLWLLVQRSKTLGAALKRFQDYFYIYTTSIDLHLSCDDSGLAFLHYEIDRENSYGGSLQATESGMAALIRDLRQFLGGEFEPTMVQLRHAPPKDLRLHHQLLSPKLEFNSSADAIVFPAGLLDRPIYGTDTQVARIVEAELRCHAPNRASVDRSRAEAFIRMMLPHRPCLLPDIAKELGMSARSLQVRLAECGTSFQEIHNDIRINLSKKYLTHSNLSIAEIAELLQFSEPSAFTRFFKSLMGATPRKFRQSSSSINEEPR